jgi:hypothetical protein
MLLLYAADPGLVLRSDRPAWVNEWLAGRQARAEKKAAAVKEPKPVDAESQAERRDQRLRRVRDGMAELHLWITDWIKSGMASAPSKGLAYFDSQARRLIDAQAPGVARRVQELGSISARGAGWQRPFLEQLCVLHLLCRATERIDELGHDDRANLLGAFGIAVSQDELAKLPAVRDVWCVACQSVRTEDRLRVQETWLYGRETGRQAVILHFAHGTAPLDTSLVAGHEFDGEIVFHPGTGIRAAVRTTPIECSQTVAPFGFDCFAAALDSFGRTIAANPWIDRILLPVRDVTPIRVAGSWSAIDKHGESLRLAISEKTGWRLLAVAGRSPIDMAAVFDGKSLADLSVTANGKFHPLVDTEQQTE